MRRARSPIICWRMRSGSPRSKRRNLMLSSSWTSERQRARSGTHTAESINEAPWAAHSATNADLWLWAPAFAGATRGSVLRLAEGGAERMGRIDADDAEFAGEEFQLLQRKGEVPVVRMAVDIGVELRGKEIAVDHVAFELGHVDAVGGKAAHRLVERRREVAHAENKSGDQRRRALFGPVRFAGQHDKAGGVMGFVLDVLGQNVEAVN